MGVFSFKGGVHPPYNKDLTNSKSIVPANLPKELVIPMSQHIGAPCEPTVAVGDNVKEGQLIGKSTSFVSAPIHSPTSGKVKKIEERLHPLGKKVLSVVIEPDGENEKVYMEPLGDDPAKIDAEKILERVKEAGIVGMGGATFPTHIKFSPPKDKPIDTLILNGCECEPYLTADHRIMLERGNDVVLGARMIAKVLKVKRIIIAIENNKPDAIEELKSLSSPYDIEVVATATKYPQGAEKMLIKALLDREVPSGGLPMDVGVVVSNVGTSAAVCEAVRDGKPLIERVVTVTGNAVKKPGNFLSKIGIPIASLVEQAGGVEGNLGKIIMGGPMMGISQPSMDVPIMKGSSGILLLQKEDYMTLDFRACIKCSFCVRVCPVHLLPSTLSIIGEAKKWELAEKYGVNDCIECGSCAYVCPSKRPIVHFIKTTKAKLREIKAMEKK